MAGFFPLTDTIFQTTMSFVYRYISFPWKIDCQTACRAFRIISKMQILCLKNATHGESRLTPAGKIYLIFFSLCSRFVSVEILKSFNFNDCDKISKQAHSYFSAHQLKPRDSINTLKNT